MTRADVHLALAIDEEIWGAAQVDPSLLDPVVRVDSVPGTAHPFVVVRDYQGPQGAYLEQFVLTDPAGRELHRSVERRVELRGEQFEDRIITRVPRLVLDRGEEHAVTLLVDGHEVGSVPVFLEVGGGGDPAVMAEETFAKALGKGAVLWLVIPQEERKRRRKQKGIPRGLVYDDHQQPVWFVYDGGTVYVFSGPTEQEVRGLTPDTPEVRLVARSKDHRSAVVRTTATVAVVPPEDPRWAKVADAALGRRLNLVDGEGAVDRWRERCTLYALTPTFAGAPPVKGVGGAPAPVVGPSSGSAEEGGSPGGDAAPAAKPKRPEDDIHVEAQIDQAVFEKLLAEGKSERVARAQAKAAFVRAEKKRILAERGG
jgi:hypothetical protein